MEPKAEEPEVPYGQPLTFEKVWEMFQETRKMLEESALQQQATERFLKELFKETDRQFKETDRQFKETDKKFKETDKKINSVHDYFEIQWGRLMESLVRGDLVKILRKKGINVISIAERRSGCVGGDNFEFDLLALDTTVMVVVEVKTTLRVNDVKKLLKKLKKVKVYLPEYQSKTVYGGVAFLQANAGSEVMAESRGLFVIRATGSSASIINKEDFVPKTF